MELEKDIVVFGIMEEDSIVYVGWRYIDDVREVKDKYIEWYKEDIITVYGDKEWIEEIEEEGYPYLNYVILNKFGKEEFDSMEVSNYFYNLCKIWPIYGEWFFENDEGKIVLLNAYREPIEMDLDKIFNLDFIRMTKKEINEYKSNLKRDLEILKMKASQGDYDAIEKLSLIGYARDIFLYGENEERGY